MPPSTTPARAPWSRRSEVFRARGDRDLCRLFAANLAEWGDSSQSSWESLIRENRTKTAKAIPAANSRHGNGRIPLPVLQGHRGCPLGDSRFRPANRAGVGIREWYEQQLFPKSPVRP